MKMQVETACARLGMERAYYAKPQVRIAAYIRQRSQHVRHFQDAETETAHLQIIKICRADAEETYALQIGFAIRANQKKIDAALSELLQCVVDMCAELVLC
eukprot:GEMP01084273.1.p4 GENE.GEMP01084273.1~~GEMP01084273.1.p4  ORF type:complete len:101 (+),score=15.27 GEMP01084273.1:326-628(+)